MFSKSEATKDWKRYKKLKANLQRESRQADTKFMQDIVSEDNYKYSCSDFAKKRYWVNVK
jgi:hypothetical protein